MKYNNYILLGIAFTALPVSIQAQTQPEDTTVNRTVVVEQQYNPNIMDAAKVNVLPKVEEPSVSKKEVEYATFTTPATSIPSETIDVYGGKETQPKFIPGYVRLGYGTYGNLDILANYLFRLSDRDKLNVNFKMDGMNGTLDMPFGDTPEWDAFYYRTRAHVDYVHQFAKLDLNIAGKFGLSNFNYKPHGFKKQKFTSGDIHVGVKSTDETLPWQYRAETNLMLYGRELFQFFGGVNETMIRTLANVSNSMSDEQTIGVRLAMNNLIYNYKQKEYKEDIKSIFKSRTTFDLNPYYELNNDNWRVHLGANADLSFGSGRAIRMSTDLKVQYVFSDSYVLYAKATGGRLLNDFRRLETYNPYLNPNREVKDTYEQLNTGIGFKASPTPGLWFNLFGGYQNLKDDLYQLSDRWTGVTEADFINLGLSDTENFYAGLKASYEYKDLFAISASGTYYNWEANYQADKPKPDDYYYALQMKPEFDFVIHTEIHPITRLWLNADYQYTRRTKLDNVNNGNIIPAVSDLSLGATYKIVKGISAYAKVHNLLNKKYQYYLNYPVEGLNFVVGASLLF